VRDFIWGVLCMASLVAALHFLRYWRLSGDRLFGYFALAFAAFSANWLGIALVHPAREAQTYVYLIRLAAFVILIIGIVDKNRRGKRA
jgi:hypothetical protein